MDGDKMIINQNKKMLTMLCIWLFLSLISCTESGSDSAKNDLDSIGITQIQSEPLSTHSPEASLTPTLSSSTNTIPFYTPTLYPTLTEKQAEVIANKQNDPRCKLPCYLGITPGKTTFEEAENILLDLEAKIEPKYPLIIQEVNFKYIYFFGSYDPPIRHVISLIVRDNIIIEMDVSVTPIVRPPQQEFYETWMRYAPRELLDQLGMPDVMYVNYGDYDFDPGYIIYFNYEVKGIYLRFYGKKQNGLVCPSFNENGIDSFDLVLIDPSYFNGFFLLGSHIEAHPRYAETIEEAFGITEQQFYKQVSSDTDVCFEPIYSE